MTRHGSAYDAGDHLGTSANPGTRSTPTTLRARRLWRAWPITLGRSVDRRRAIATSNLNAAAGRIVTAAKVVRTTMALVQAIWGVRAALEKPPIQQYAPGTARAAHLWWPYVS